jgi:hypothetical protein
MNREFEMTGALADGSLSLIITHIYQGQAVRMALSATRSATRLSP